jgi:peptidoglycan/xylan/chitin deacetylase (PgdA/CDA1 family)/glycosyltransferase involved in cell wall biosynthesis
MRILLLTNDFPSPWLPTKATFNWELARALGRENEVHVVAPIPWTDELQVRHPIAESIGTDRLERRDDVTIHYPRYYYLPKVGRLWHDQFLWHSVRATLHGKLAGFRPEAVVGYWTYPDGAVAVKYARQIGAAAFIVVGGSDVLVQARESRRRRRVIAATLHAADGVFTVSDDLRRRVIELGVPAERVHLTYRGVDRAQFTPGDRFAARERLGINHGLPLFLSVGRLVPVKGLDVLLQAANNLKSRGETFELALVGEGAERTALERTTTELGLDNNVRFIGPVPHADLADWYRAADLTVLSSRSEGVPNVLLESHACGIPFVATRVGGVGEIALEGVDRLAGPDNATELAEQMAGALASATTPPEKIASRVSDLDTTARKLVGVLQSAVAHSADCGIGFQDGPRGAAPYSNQVESFGKRLNPFRQVARHALSTFLPSGLFLTEGPLHSGRVCLTFDDGPHPQHTPPLLDTLGEFGIQATFFIIGREAEKHPDLVKRIASAGHSIGNHTWSHPLMAKLSVPSLIDEVRRTGDLLADLTGAETTLFRPPMGKVTARQLFALWRIGQTVVLWNRDPRDYQCHTASELRQRLRSVPLQDSDLFLLHDNHPHAAAVLPDLAADVRAAGLRFGTVSDWTSKSTRHPDQQSLTCT